MARDEYWVELTEKNIDKHDLPRRTGKGREELLAELAEARKNDQRKVVWIR